MKPKQTKSNQIQPSGNCNQSISLFNKMVEKIAGVKEQLWKAPSEEKTGQENTQRRKDRRGKDLARKSQGKRPAGKKQARKVPVTFTRPHMTCPLISLRTLLVSFFLISHQLEYIKYCKNFYFSFKFTAYMALGKFFIPFLTKMLTCKVFQNNPSIGNFQNNFSLQIRFTIYT